MNHIRSIIASFLLCVSVPLAVGLAGCATSEIAPGSERWVVETERSIKLAFRVVDGFLLWEAQNRSFAGKDATLAADILREKFPGYYRSAVSTLRVYKASRTPENRANLQTVVNTINEASVQALKFLPTEKAEQLTSQN